MFNLVFTSLGPPQCVRCSSQYTAMKPKPLPPLERLVKLFEVVPIPVNLYTHHSGLVRRVQTSRCKSAGSDPCVRTITRKGHPVWRLSLGGKSYLAHRIIYKIHYGVDPGCWEIDHEDQNPDNNNVWNLRLADDETQSHNKPKRADNLSGLTGIYKCNRTGKWRAQLMIRQKYVLCSYHSCLIEAAASYNVACKEHIPEHAEKKLHDVSKILCLCEQCRTNC